jgi:hypothetical protein
MNKDLNYFFNNLTVIIEWQCKHYFYKLYTSFGPKLRSKLFFNNLTVIIEWQCKH